MKKGFTLVELLAVIAILAILVIIALPNVMGMFNTAKENSFKTEVKEIFKTAEQQWMTDSMYSTNDKVYVRTKTNSCNKSLDLSGRTDLEYYIKLDKSGKVVEYYATDGTFQYSYTGNGLKVENINNVKKVAEITNDNQRVTITCSGGANITCSDFNNSSSWADVISSIKNGKTECMNVGDTKDVDMGSFGTHKLRIANTTTPSECSNSGFSQTACGFVLEFVDIITEHNMSDSGSNDGGWPATDMRIFVNNEIYNALPSDIKNSIINTTVVSGYGTHDTENFVSTDKLYLLTPKEIFNDNASFDHASSLTRQLDYYQSISVNSESTSGAIKNYNSESSSWSLRTAYYYRQYLYYRVYEDGGYFGDTGYVGDEYGVSPAFRIG